VVLEGGQVIFKAATEEIDLKILASELVASEDPLAALEITWELLLFRLLALLLLEQILFSVALPYPALMSKWAELLDSTYSQMFSLIAMKNRLWLLQKRRTVRVAPLETSTATSKSRVTYVFPKKSPSLKIQWNKSKQLEEPPRILSQLKPQM
jgi:hypothetical protein